MSQFFKAARFFKSHTTSGEHRETPALVFFAMVIGATFFI